MRRLVPLVHS
jgi:hypothetical protein